MRTPLLKRIAGGTLITALGAGGYLEYSGEFYFLFAFKTVKNSNVGFAKRTQSMTKLKKMSVQFATSWARSRENFVFLALPI